MLREMVVEEKLPQIEAIDKFLSQTPPYPTSKKILDAKKSVFNYTPCDNDFELSFAKYLDKADDIEAFSKLPEQFGFCIQYTDTRANIRNYYPDFIARMPDGGHWLIETKGREDIEVAMKDAAARHWCDTANELTGQNWSYVKVSQKEYENLHPQSFEELVAVINAEGLFG